MKQQQQQQQQLQQQQQRSLQEVQQKRHHQQQSSNYNSRCDSFGFTVNDGSCFPADNAAQLLGIGGTLAGEEEGHQHTDVDRDIRKRKATAASNNDSDNDSVIQEEQIRWALYLQENATNHGCVGDHIGNKLQLEEELKLCRQMGRRGIPNEFRAEVWAKWSGSQHRMKGQPQYYQKIFQQHLNDESVAAHDIELDLLRTFPNNVNYAFATSPNVSKLRRVLITFAWHNQRIGYCQGMSHVVAFLLLVFQEEEAAFWLLTTIIEDHLPPGYYSPDLRGSHADQLALAAIIEKQFPRLHDLFKKHALALPLVTLHWFITIYTSVCGIQVALRIWDAFVLEGRQVLFRVALNLFTLNEARLLAMEDMEDIYMSVISLPATIQLSDVDTILAPSDWELGRMPNNSRSSLNSLGAMLSRLLDSTERRPSAEQQLEQVRREVLSNLDIGDNDQPAVLSVDSVAQNSQITMPIGLPKSSDPTIISSMDDDIERPVLIPENQIATSGDLLISSNASLSELLNALSANNSRERSHSSAVISSSKSTPSRPCADTTSVAHLSPAVSLSESPVSASLSTAVANGLVSVVNSATDPSASVIYDVPCENKNVGERKRIQHLDRKKSKYTSSSQPIKIHGDRWKRKLLLDRQKFIEETNSQTNNR